MHVLSIDARNLTTGINGISRYLSQMLIHLAANDVKLNLYLHKPIHADFDYIKRLNNISVRYCKHLLGNIIYPNSFEGLFWGPAHRLPPKVCNRRPTILTVHDLVWQKHPKTMPMKRLVSEKLNFYRSVRAATKIITVSNTTKKELLSFYPELKTEVSVICPGANKLSDERVVISKKQYFLFVGTFEPRKNIEFLIRSYSKMPNHIKEEVSLYLAGSIGWGAINLSSLIKKYSVEKYTQVFYSPNDQDLHVLYSRAIAFVSFSKYEGFGIPAAEALKYGKPIIVPGDSAMAEIGGNACITLKHFEIDQACQLLIDIALDQKLRNQLSIAAEHEASKFSWENSSRLFLEICRSIS